MTASARKQIISTEIVGTCLLAFAGGGAIGFRTAGSRIRIAAG